MPQNLFAACRVNGALVAKRIRLDQAVQQQIETIFNQQETEFRDGITSEVDFDGSWTPDDDEFLTIDVPQEATIFTDTLNANPVAIPDIDTANFEAEGIKGIFTGVAVNGAMKVLVQRFSEPDPKRVEWHQGFMILSGCEARRNDECLGLMPPGAIMRVGHPVMQAI